MSDRELRSLERQILMGAGNIDRYIQLLGQYQINPPKEVADIVFQIFMSKFDVPYFFQESPTAQHYIPLYAVGGLNYEKMGTQYGELGLRGGLVTTFGENLNSCSLYHKSFIPSHFFSGQSLFFYPSSSIPTTFVEFLLYVQAQVVPNKSFITQFVNSFITNDIPELVNQGLPINLEISNFTVNSLDSNSESYTWDVEYKLAIFQSLRLRITLKRSWRQDIIRFTIENNIYFNGAEVQGLDLSGALFKHLGYPRNEDEEDNFISFEMHSKERPYEDYVQNLQELEKLLTNYFTTVEYLRD